MADKGKVTLAALARPGPNPDAWTDTNGAAEILGRGRSTVYDFVARGTLHQYRLGAHTMYWIDEVLEVRHALDRLSR